MGSVHGDRPPVAPPEAVVNLLSRLNKKFHSLTLEDIDGEFYWRCCRLDFVAAVAEWRRRLAGPEGKKDLFFEMRMSDDLHGRFGVPHRRALYHAMRGDPIPLRAPGIGLSGGTDPMPSPGPGPSAVGNVLTIRIPSGAWVGEDVERLATRWVEENAAHIAPLPREPTAEREAESVRFAFVEKRRGPSPVATPARLYSVFDAGDGPDMFVSHEAVPPPFVRVDVSLPLLRRGALAKAYDGVVRNGYGWHGWLPGIATQPRQEPAVAMRTWAVCLLMRSRLSFDAATDVVAESLGPHFQPANRKRHDKCRDDLKDRVPEAERYLFVRAPRRA